MIFDDSVIDSLNTYSFILLSTQSTCAGLILIFIFPAKNVLMRVLKSPNFQMCQLQHLTPADSKLKNWTSALQLNSCKHHLKGPNTNAIFFI